MVQALKAKMKEQKGFTLIELLAVIVILGIIAAIAIPAIGNVISKSDKKANVQDALQIISAAKYYVAEKAPTAATTTLTLNGGETGAGTTGDPAALDPYLDRVRDNGFTVTISYTAGTETTPAKYTYSISNHDAVPIVDPSKAKTGTVTEKKLTEYKQ